MKLLIGLTIVFIILVSSNFINAFINEKEGNVPWEPNGMPLPRGSWIESCKTEKPDLLWQQNIYGETKLTTKCLNKNNQYIRTSITGDRKNKYKNVNGVLTIDSETNTYPGQTGPRGPRGPY